MLSEAPLLIRSSGALPAPFRLSKAPLLCLPFWHCSGVTSALFHHYVFLCLNARSKLRLNLRFRSPFNLSRPLGHYRLYVRCTPTLLSPFCIYIPLLGISTARICISRIRLVFFIPPNCGNDSFPKFHLPNLIFLFHHPFSMTSSFIQSYHCPSRYHRVPGPSYAIFSFWFNRLLQSKMLGDDSFSIISMLTGC